MHKFAMPVLAALLGLALAGPAGADTAQLLFSAAEKATIQHYFGDGSGGAAQPGKDGKGKKGKGVGNQGLPPGLAKKQQLPPGIAKRQLPTTLIAQLPPPPKGFERVIVDDNVLLVEIATQIVQDIVEHAVR